MKSMSDEPTGTDPHNLHNFLIELSPPKCGLTAANFHRVVAATGQTVFKLPHCGHDEELWTLGHKAEHEG